MTIPSRGPFRIRTSLGTRLARALLAIALIFPASPGPVTAATAPSVPASVLSALRVQGNGLVDSSGQRVILRGVNRMGTEYMCAQDRGIVDGPMDRAAIAAIKSWGTNAVRIPLNEHCWLGIDDGTPTPEYVGETYRQTIEDVVQLLIANGLYPILDLHWSAPAGQSAIGQRPMPNTSYSADFWTSVATHFKSDTRVIFDLYNETVPNNNASDDSDDAARRSWECWRDGGVASCDATLDLGTESTRMSASEAVGMRTLVDAVRATGATNVIMLGGIQWANTLWSSGAHNWLAYKPTDPTGNIVAAVHIYPNARCITVSCFDSEIAPIATRVPVVTGEFGYPNCDAVATTWLNTLMSWLGGKQIGLLAWAWITSENEQDACMGLKLIADFNGTPTPYGLIFKTYLAGLPVDTTTTLSSSAARSLEGQTVTFTARVAAIADPRVPAGSVVFALDGTDVQTVALDGAGRATFATSFADNGVRGLAARYLGADAFHPSTSPTFSQVVENVAPAADTMVGPVDPFSVGTPLTVRAAFTDPGTADTHVATVDWGDGTTSRATIAETNGAGTLTASHTYSAAGIYKLVATVEDDDGGTAATAIESVIVFDRSAGFAGGVGWIDSASGAAADPTATARATFAFAAWYPPNAAVPSGKTYVALRSSHLTFESTRYDWLVIAGAKAQLRGSGRVNGAGGYAFLLSAIDGRESGAADRLRIKIWNSATGEVVYDNQVGAPDLADPVATVGGGGIAIRAQRGSD